MESMSTPLTFTFEEVEQGLRNVGIDPTCGACMSIFFTNFNMSLHTCPEPHAEVVVTYDEPTELPLG